MLYPADNIIAEPIGADLRIPSQQRSSPGGSVPTDIFQAIANEFPEKWFGRDTAISFLQLCSCNAGHVIDQTLSELVKGIWPLNQAGAHQEVQAQPMKELAPADGELAEEFLSFCFRYCSLDFFPQCLQSSQKTRRSFRDSLRPRKDVAMSKQSYGGTDGQAADYDLNIVKSPTDFMTTFVQQRLPELLDNLHVVFVVATAPLEKFYGQ